MTLDELYAELRQQALSGSLQINEATTGTPGLDALIREALQITTGTIVVTDTTPDDIGIEPGVQVTATGRTSFLGVSDMPARFVFREISDGKTTAIQFTMTTDLPSDWTLGVSFESFRGMPIDEVVLLSPQYLFATWQHSDSLDWYGATVTQTLIAGLNTRAGTVLQGAFAVVESLLKAVGVISSSNPYFWHGTITQSETGLGPVGNFRAELGINLDLNFIKLTNAFIGADLDFIPIEQNDDGSLVEEPEFMQNQQLCFGGFLTLGVAPVTFTLDVAAMLTNNNKGLMIGVQPAQQQETVEQGLEPVMGQGSSWSDLMPAWFRDEYLSLFGIKDVTFYFNIWPTPALLLTQTTVGTLKELVIIPDKFSVYVDVTWSIYMPLTSDRRQSIALYAELAVLTDFVFIIEIFLDSGGNFSITGRYPGTITFTLAELSNLLFDNALYSVSSPKIPSDLATFSFSDFSLSFAVSNSVKVWEFNAAADIEFNFFGLVRLALNNVNLSVTTTFAGGKTTYEGHLSGQLAIERFTFDIRAQIGSTIDTIFEVKFGNWSVGDFITYIMEVVTGDNNYTLPSPWNLLNTINLVGLGITINVTKGTWGIVYSLQQPVNLGFITINALTAGYDSATKAVNLDIQGSFLGQPMTKMNLMDPNTIPQVPGGGDSVFELFFLAFGQRVRIDGLPLNASMSQIITAMRTAFRQKPPTQVPVGTKPVSGQLVFDPNSNWMIAAQMRIISAIEISLIFNDPNLYGLLVSITGDKLKNFTGLRFEILYRKITETIGVYQMELRLPDAMRTLQFGAVSFTIPVIGIAIYTNGNFRLDFGFPTNNDFTRSFTVQVLPFIGSGGFYFALLSEKTSTRLPAHDPDRGTFNPVIEFGIGLDIGLGKTINAGILKAGLSLTFRGIVEGVFAFFNPNKSAYPTLKDDTYYWLKGTFGIVGKIYGEVDFAIVQASVNIEVFALVSITIEAYKPMILYFEAGVRVSLTVRINLGLFKINIRLSFSAVIKESFTIDMGSGVPPWVGTKSLKAAASRGPLLRSLNRRALLKAAAAPMDWKPFDLSAKSDLTFLFLPQITVAVADGAGSSTDQRAVFATVLYLRTLAPGTTPGADDGDDFSRLAETVFLWAIASLIDTGTTITDLNQILSQTVTRQQLRDIFDWLAGAAPGEPPLTYKQIIDFLNGAFTLGLEAPDNNPVGGDNDDPQEFHVSVFPIIPDLTMTATLNGAQQLQVDFASETPVDAAYHAEIQAYFEKLAVRYQNELERRADADDTAANQRLALAPGTESLATYIFRDFFTILTRSTVQSAIDLLDSFNHAATASDTLQGLATTFGSTPELIAANNSTMTLGVATMAIAGVDYQVENAQSFDAIAAVFGQQGSAADTFLQALGALDQDVPNLLREGAVLDLGTAGMYTIQARDTLRSVADQHQTTPGTIVVLNRAKTDILVSFTPIGIPQFTTTLDAGDSFESVANYYNAPIAALAAANKDLAGIFAEGQTITLPNLESLTVSALVDKMQENYSFVNLGGMSGRYLLHGMRVPPPAAQPSARLKAEWADAQETYALYALTGQEFPLPALADTDTFTVELALTPPPQGAEALRSTGHWLAMRGTTSPGLAAAATGVAAASTAVQITFTPEEITEINAMAATRLEPDIVSFAPQRMFRQEAARYNLNDGLVWQSDAPVALPNHDPATKAFLRPTVWNLPATMIAALAEPRALPPAMQLMIGRQEQPNQPMTELPVQNFAWSVRVQVTVRQVPVSEGSNVMQPFTFEVVGTDDAGKTLLEDLLLYYYNKDSSIIDRVSILYNPNPAGATPQGLMADGVDNISTFILKTNLSTVANPTFALMAKVLAVEEETALGNLVNEHPADSLLQVWEASVVRSGGFYLYYRVNATDSGLPASIFNGNSDAVLTFVITLNITDNVLPPFVNSAVVGDETGEGGHVFAVSQLQTVNVSLTSSTKLADLLANYRISLATLADLLADKTLAQGAVLALDGVIFELDSSNWTAAAIAQKFAVSEQALRDLNPGVDFNALAKWTALNIPPTTTTIANATTTAAAVAAANRLTVQALLFANLDRTGLFAPTTVALPDQNTVQTATVPAGNTAFELVRRNPDVEGGVASLAARDADHSLELLYNLLGFGVAANQDFDASVEALPLGFGDNDTAEQNIDPRTRPAETTEDEFWTYGAVVPVTPFVRQVAAAADSAVPDPTLNPYLGIGRLFQIRAVLQDMFGNQTYTAFTDPALPAAPGSVLNNMPMRIGFTDDLVGIESWPAVNTGYVFGLVPPPPDAGVPTLSVLFSFDPANYLPSTDENAAPYKDVATADKEVYRSVYYQLTDDNTGVTLATSLNSDVKTVDKTTLVNFVASIFGYLSAISDAGFEYTYYVTQEGDTLEHIAQQYGVTVADIERLNPGTPDAPPVGTRIVIPVVPLPANVVVSTEEQCTTTDTIFALTVIMTIQRSDQSVDGQFKGDADVRRSATVLFPLTQKTDRTEEDGDYYTLEQFARDFEAAYPHAKPAVSPADLADAANQRVKNMWVVQFGNSGIQYTIDKGKPLFFAPIPLANQLITGTDFTVYPYVSREGLNFERPLTKTFTGIELDTWAQVMLQSIDDFLSPAYVIPAFIVDQTLGTAYYNQVLDAKKKIAAAFRPLVQNLQLDKMTPTYEANRLAAADSLEQVMLTALLSAYTTTSIVQYNVNVGGEHLPAGLFGQPTGPEAVDTGGSAPQEYSVSTARIALDAQTSYLTYLFSARQPEEQQNFDLDLAFKINALEHDIHSVGPQFGEYKASSWLNFILPLASEPLGESSIPVPLRAYPTPPSLLDQQAVRSQAGPLDIGTDLKVTREWNYVYAYEPVSAAQDRIHTNIRFNVQGSQLKAFAAEQPDLFEALAMYINVSAGLQDDLVNVVALINQSSSASDIQQAGAIISSFAFLVTAAADAWGSWLSARSKYLKPIVSTDEFEFCVEEYDDNGRFRMNVTQLRNRTDAGFPLPSFDGYETVTVLQEPTMMGFEFRSTENPNDYLTPAQAAVIRSRTMQYSELDIMETQNAWAGVFVVRNENLFDTEHTCVPAIKTNPNFLYQTPTVRYSNVVTPLLDWSDALNVADLVGAKPPQTLVTYLGALFAAYFAGVPNSVEHPVQRQLTVSSAYQYRINTLTEPLDVVVPLNLVPPFDFTLPTDWGTDCGTAQSFVCMLADRIKAWFRDNRPSGDQGRILFDVATFSSLSDSRLPVYRLRNLFLAVDDISDLGS